VNAESYYTTLKRLNPSRDPCVSSGPSVPVPDGRFLWWCGGR
jgi:hypothetical protein